jgi:hypothetical protein
MAMNATDKRKGMLKGLMSRAHFNSAWKKNSGDKRAYREIFADMLRLEWSRAKTAEEAKRSYIVREQLREEQNFGLPVGSCLADRARTYHRGSRMSAVGE